MIPIPETNPIKPALRKEMVMTETSELDCITVVVNTPKEMHFQNESVDRDRIFSRTPPVKLRNPSSRKIIPNKKIATPAAIALKSGLILNPKARIVSIATRKIFFITVSDTTCAVG